VVRGAYQLGTGVRRVWSVRLVAASPGFESLAWGFESLARSASFDASVIYEKPATKGLWSE